jgi:hypothetical protein
MSLIWKNNNESTLCIGDRHPCPFIFQDSETPLFKSRQEINTGDFPTSVPYSATSA